MFARSVMVLGTLSELSHSAQVLYMALNMLADDDGFIGNARVIMRQCRCTAKHLKVLLEEGFLLQFPNGPMVIAHWLVHNQLRKDRYKPTIYQEEFKQLLVEKNKPYRFLQPGETGCQKVAPPATQESRAEQSKGKQNKAYVSGREDKVGKENPGTQFLVPEDHQSSITDYEKSVLDLYIQYCQGMVECLYLDEKVKEKIQRLEQIGWNLATLESAFRMAGESDFLKGENKDGWVCSLDWLCEDENLRKVCAGRYRSYKKKPPVIYGATGQLGEVELEELQRLLREG